MSTYLRTIAATAVGVSTLVKGMFGTLAAVAVGTASLTTALLFTQTLAAIGTATAILSTAATFGKNLVSSAIGIAGLIADFIAGGAPSSAVRSTFTIGIAIMICYLVFVLFS